MSTPARRATGPRPGAAGDTHVRRFFRVLNRSRGTLIGDAVRLAGSSAERRRGLLGVDRLSEGEGLWISPCEGIHTFGMRFALDLVFLSRDSVAVKTVSALQPWRISFCWRAASVLELPPGTIARCCLATGDLVEITPSAAQSH